MSLEEILWSQLKYGEEYSGGEIKHVTVIAIILLACNLTELVLGLPHKASPQR